MPSAASLLIRAPVIKLGKIRPGSVTLDEPLDVTVTEDKIGAVGMTKIYVEGAPAMVVTISVPGPEPG